jgi:hypothetical protein
MIKPLFNVVNGNLTKSINYIDKSGNNPKFLSVIRWNKLVFEKNDLTSDNWLYIGSKLEEIRQQKISSIRLDNGNILITG